MESVWQDVRLALRLVRRSPGFAATIVLTLALGIGANTAIFGVINGLLLRPLPVADPQRLVTISSDFAIARGVPTGFGWSFAMWEALQSHVPLFDSAIAWTPARFDLANSGERQIVDGVFTSGGYFASLGVPAILGRTYTAADDRPGGGVDGPVAVISYGLWQRRFGGAASVIGTPLVVDGVTVTIVGVTPPEFFGVDVGRAFDVALPLATEPLVHANRSALRLPLLVMLRLKPGQSLEAGTDTLRSLQPAILGVTPDGMATVRPPHNREPFTLVSAAAGTSLPVRGPSGLRQSYARPLFTILVVVLLVLVIACVNIANLLLARATARRHEISVRLSLGAPRVRLTRQLLVESLVLAAFGAIGGLVIAAWGSQALVAQLSTPTNRITLDLSFDWRVLIFTAGVAVATTGIFGTVPALRASRVAPMDVLKRHGRSASQYAGGAGRLATLPSGLVIVQIALSLALVVAAALFVRSFARLSHVPLGFDPDRVLVVNVDLQRAPHGSHRPAGPVSADRGCGGRHPGSRARRGLDVDAGRWRHADGGLSEPSGVQLRHAGMVRCVRHCRADWPRLLRARYRRGSAGRRRKRSVRARAHAGTLATRRDDPVPPIQRRRKRQRPAHDRRDRGRCGVRLAARGHSADRILADSAIGGERTERADRDQHRRPPLGGIADAARAQRRRGSHQRRSRPVLHIPSAEGSR